ncbi:hypothetical protein [Actinomadura violacea]|uniref:Uncharacterized protein n=1 Tax=Actinomadura violacea TaxID=2819934 RepID=A0ABS3S7L3_9ACTN|nr:hypothetical protein [Actinomadura violacea]MBO2464996.1 hypothetical protein [Actinomadura violacea]
MTSADGWGEHQQRLQYLVAHAAWLIESLAAQGDRDRRIDQAAFTEGYRLGFAAGRDVGYGQAHQEIAQDWARLAAKVRRMARVPTFAELQARRAEVPPPAVPRTARPGRGRAA